MKDKIINHFKMISSNPALIGLSIIVVISAIGVLLTQPNYDILTFLSKTFGTIQSFMTNNVVDLFTGMSGDNLIVIISIVGLILAIIGNPISLKVTYEDMVNVPGKRNRERVTITKVHFSVGTLVKVIINFVLQLTIFAFTLFITLPILITLGFFALTGVYLIPTFLLNSVIGNITISSILALALTITLIVTLYQTVLRYLIMGFAAASIYVINLTTQLTIGKMFIGQAVQQVVEEEGGEVIARYRQFAENAIAALVDYPNIQKAMRKLGDMIERNRESILKVGQARNEDNQTYSIRQYNMLPYASKEVIIKDGERHFLIPIHFQNSSNMTPSEFTSRLKAEDLGIAFNPNKGGFVSWFVDHSKGGQLYLEVMTEALIEKVPDSIPFIEKLSTRLSKLSWTELKTAMGVNKKGETVYIDPSSSEQVHLLIAGSSGGGKSVFIAQILFDWIINLTPEQIELYIVDPKLEYRGISMDEVPHVKHIASGPKEIKKAINIVKLFVKEMNERYEYLSSKKFNTLASYNKANPGNELPWKFLIIDEMGGLTDMMEGKEKDAFLKSLGLSLKLARACGMLVLLSTQSPNAESIPNKIRDNINTRICLKTKSPMQTNQILGMPSEDVDPRSFEGRGRALVIGGSVSEEIRGTFLDLENKEQNKYIEEAISKYGKREEKEIKDIELEDLSEDEETAEDEYIKEEEQYNSDIQEVVIRDSGFSYMKSLNDHDKEKLYQALVDCFHNEGKVSKEKLISYAKNLGLEQPVLFFQKVLEEFDIMGITYKDGEARNAHRKLAVPDKASIKGIVIKNLS